MLRLSSLSLLIGFVVLIITPPREGAPVPLVSEVPVPVSDECSFNEALAPVEDFMSLVTISDPYLGNLDSDVTVIEFFDPNCPHCATFHPVMKQVIEDTGQHARFYMIPFPLWQYSLLQTEALYVAAQESKYFDMLDAQYLHQKQGGMSLQELIVLAEDIGMDGEQFSERVQRGLNQQMILERRRAIVETGVRGTPSVMINGRFVASDSKSRVCLNELIAEAATPG
jgi:protein-disulfide isomerase